jgi:hypothetical protein
MKLVRVGYGNLVATDRILCILNYGSLPTRKLKEDAKANKSLIDTTQGRKTRTVIVLDTNHIVLSALASETISQRLED